MHQLNLIKNLIKQHEYLNYLFFKRNLFFKNTWKIFSRCQRPPSGDEKLSFLSSHRMTDSFLMVFSVFVCDDSLMSKRSIPLQTNYLPPPLPRNGGSSLFIHASSHFPPHVFVEAAERASQRFRHADCGKKSL